MAAMVGKALVFGGLMLAFAAVLAAVVFATSGWIAVKGLYLTLLRPFLYRAGKVEASAYDYELEGWHAERAGNVALAVDRYIKALEMNRGNLALRQRLAAMTDRELPPDTNSPILLLEYVLRNKDRLKLREQVALHLPDVPPEAWEVVERGDDTTAAVVWGKEVAAIRVATREPQIRFAWEGGTGDIEMAKAYLAAAINRAVKG